MQKKTTKPTVVKFAIAQISTDPGDISGNKDKIIEYINKAKGENASIIIFPELAIPGYMALDLMLRKDFVEENLKALNEIKAASKDILVIVGFIDIDQEGRRYNSAAIIFDQKIKAIQDKTLLPDYDVFFENRYFAPARGRSIVKFQNLNIGVEICEDLWDKNYPVKVSEDLIQKGADIIINISGSPFYVGKRADREDLIKGVSSKFRVPFVYVNTVGTQDGYDGELVFDGESMIYDGEGKLVYLGKKFGEDLFFVDLEKLLKGGYNELKQSQMSAEEELLNALVLAVKAYFERTNFQKTFIGLSGGIDSAVVAYIASKALGKENVTGIYMPSRFSSETSLSDSKKLAENLSINFKVIGINDIYETYLKTLKKEFEGKLFDTTEENIQARIRGMILMAHANKFNGLIVSTANKTETALGYTTLYGDMCGAIAPLADVSKEKVYKLADFINRGGELIPENTIKKIPTAELREGQTDEASLGAPYSIISPLVDDLIEEMKSLNELRKKYPEKVIKKISHLVNINEYKRRQAAPAVKVTKKSFGIGRRIPISNKFLN